MHMHIHTSIYSYIYILFWTIKHQMDTFSLQKPSHKTILYASNTEQDLCNHFSNFTPNVLISF